MTAEEAFACLGIDRTTGYRSIKEGTFPPPVIRVGRLLRVPIAAMRRLLELGRDNRREPHRTIVLERCWTLRRWADFVERAILAEIFNVSRAASMK